MSKLYEIQTYSVDYADRSVDAIIRTNGGSYHVVEVVTIWDNGTTEREVRKCFSRTKAQTFAQYATRRKGS